MSERIRGSYDDALYKSTYTLLYYVRRASFSPIFTAPENQDIHLNTNRLSDR